MTSSSPEFDADIDLKLFAQVTKLSMLSLTASPLQAEWEYEQQTTSRKIAICEQFVDDMLVSPIIPSSSITKAEEDEMNQYVDFNYYG